MRGRNSFCALVLLMIVSGIAFSVAHTKQPEFLAVTVANAQTPATRQKTAEEVYKNIKVFKGIPAAELEGNMAFISGSLGVKCNYCHVNPFDKDEKPTKETARRMIQMVFDLNKGSFNGAGAVSCYTCHRGSTAPAVVPAVGTNLWAAVARATPEPLPAVDEVINRYVTAVGGKEAIEKVRTRVFIGSRIGADGVLVPEEVRTAAPNKLLVITSYPNLVFRNGFNGAQGWAKSNQTEREVPDEMLAELRREAQFYKETRLKELYPNMRVLGKQKVGDVDAYVVEAIPADGGNPVKLYFDAQSGLLIRKYSESKLTLGRYPTQTDYEDYRVVDGVKLPFMIRWSIPGRVWGRKITEVKQNVPIDDAEFNAGK